MTERYAGNLPRFYLYQALLYFYLWLPIGTIYMMEARHLSLTQVSVIGGAGFLLSALVEVPTGAVADVWGRRATMAMGLLLYAVAMIATGLSAGFWPLLLAGALRTTGFSFTSGADLALVYDSLQAQGRAGEFVRVQSRATSIMFGAQAAGSLAGAALATWGLQLPFLACGALAVVATLVVLTMREVPVATPAHRRTYGQILLAPLQLARQLPAVRYALLYSAACYLAPFLLFYVYFQPYARSVAIPVAWLGAVLVVLRLVSMGGSSCADRIIRWVGAGPLLWVLPLTVALATVGMGLTGRAPSLVLLALILLANAVHRPLVAAVLNERTPSEVRATVNSAGALLATLLVALVQPLLGWIADRWSVAALLVAMGAGSGLLITGILLRWRPEHTSAVRPVAAD